MCEKGKDNIEQSFRPNFKGIENFFRRIAFNLGNSPSQTEVKIISCIPIDVTDLQQKIFRLEKELNATKKNNKFNSENQNCCTSLVDDHNIDVEFEDFKLGLGLSPSKLYASYSEENQSVKELNNSNAYPLNSKMDLGKVEYQSRSTDSLISKWNMHEGNERIMNIYSKPQKKKQTADHKVNSRGRERTEMVYYAQTDIHKMDVFSNSYLNTVFRKHHDPKLVLEEISNTSDYSQPVCRDVRKFGKDLSDSDICSCCHGAFHNLDNYLNGYNITCNELSNITSKNNVNLPKLVDLIPVKDVNNVNPRLGNDDFKCEPKIVYNASCVTKNGHTKHRRVINHKEFHEIKVPKTNKNKKKITPPRKCVKWGCTDFSEPDVESSKSCYAYCSDDYVKPSSVPVSIYKKPMHLVKIKNIASEKNLNATENLQCELNKTKSDCKSTEAALNEIKRILQSVLAVVKNNARERLLKEKIKTDAIVQKGESQVNILQPPFNNYFAYPNTSHFNNPYLLSYPGHVPLAQYCLPSPLVPRSRFYNDNVELQVGDNKHLTTTSTNTDQDQSRDNQNAKETDKLIQEIYKSVVDNIDNPSRENSQIDVFKSIFELNPTVNEDKIDEPSVEKITEEVDKVIKKDARVQALLSTVTTDTTATASNLVYTATSSKSGYMSRFINRVGSRTRRKERYIPRQNYIFDPTEYVDTVDSEDYDEVKPKVEKMVKNKKKTTLIMNMFKSVFKKKCAPGKKKNAVSDTHGDFSSYSDYSEDESNIQPMRWRYPNENVLYSTANERPQPPFMQKQTTNKQAEGIKFVYTPNKYKTWRPSTSRPQSWGESVNFNNNITAKPAKKPAKTNTRGYVYRPKSSFNRNYHANLALVQQGPRHLAKKTHKPIKYNSPTICTVGKYGTSKNAMWLKRNRVRTACTSRWKDFFLNG